MTKIDEAIVLKQFQVNELSDLPKLRMIMEVQQMKPNFSLLSRELQVDRRTVKKYYNGFTKPKTKARKSKIDSLHPVIQELLSDDTLQTFYYKANLWRYLVENHNLAISESNFRKYISNHQEFQQYFNKRHSTPKQTALLRFETEPGEQLQIDWKEDIRFTTSDGEIHSLNVFVGVLGYSRYSVYLLTLNRKQETLFHALDTIFEKLGEVPKAVISDNIKTIMDEARTNYASGKINGKFDQFSKDYQFILKPYVAGRPSSKGHSPFSKPLNENNGQCDAISRSYEIDFKLLSSNTRLQASNLFSLGISNRGDGIISIHESKKKFGEVRATQIHVAFRTRDILALTQLRDNFLNIRKYCIERDIIIVLKMLEKEKKLLLFFPYSFELIDILETDNLDDIIVSALNYDFHSLFEYRSLKAKEFETYFVTIFQDKFYIFSILDDTLCLIEKVDCMSLPTFIKLKNYHL